MGATGHTRRCELCGLEFTATVWGSTIPQYCSRTCRRAAKTDKDFKQAHDGTLPRGGRSPEFWDGSTRYSSALDPMADYQRVCQMCGRHQGETFAERMTPARARLIQRAGLPRCAYGQCGGYVTLEPLDCGSIASSQLARPKVSRGDDWAL